MASRAIRAAALSCAFLMPPVTMWANGNPAAMVAASLVTFTPSSSRVTSYPAPPALIRKLLNLASWPGAKLRAVVAWQPVVSSSSHSRPDPSSASRTLTRTLYRLHWQAVSLALVSSVGHVRLD